MNGLNTLGQSGSDFMTGTLGAGLTDFSLIAVCNITSAPSAYRACFAFGGSLAPSLYLGTSLATPNVADFFFTTDHVSSTTFTNAEKLIVEYIRSGTTATVSINGVDTTAAVSGTITSNLISLMSSTQVGSEFSKHDSGEVFLYSVALGSSDRAAIRSYLKPKWGTA